jgi:DNA replication and repair protein RecF
MNLNWISLTNFRSYSKNRFELHPKLNLVIGPNGSGKTNFLEAVYVLTETRSFRAKNPDIIKYGQQFFRLEGQSKNNNFGFIYAPYKTPQKSFIIDEARVARSRFRNLQKAVLFEPNDLLLISGSPSLRRRYLDGILIKTHQDYLKIYLNYEHVLRQRNALLRTHSLTMINKQIFAWDLKLAELAGQLFLARKKLVEYFNTQIKSYYQKISKDSSKIGVKYKSEVDEGDYINQLLVLLGQNLKKDVLLGNTSYGPHRDDITFNISERLFKQTASRGEERTLILALKLLELKYVQQKTNIQPLLLLDDVMSELDPFRQQFLLNLLDTHQTIITTTDIKNIETIVPVEHSLIRL